MEDIAGYEIICEVSIYGKETKYKAKHRELRRMAVLSIVDEKFFSSDGFIFFFKQLAVDIQNLNHPNMLSVFELGRVKQYFYIATEYFEFLTVEKFLKEAKISGQSIPLQAGCFIVEQVAFALQDAHKKGICLACLDTESVLLCSDGRVKVSGFTDFNRFYRKSELNIECDLNCLKTFAKRIFSCLMPGNTEKTALDLILKVIDGISSTEEFVSALEALKQKYGFLCDQDELKDIMNKMPAALLSCSDKIGKKELDSKVSEKKYPANRKPVIFLYFVLTCFGLLFLFSNKEKKAADQFFHYQLNKQNIFVNRPETNYTGKKQDVVLPTKKESVQVKNFSDQNTISMIFVSVQPADAKVFFDGLFKGEGDRVIKNVPEGKHILKITYPEYEDEVRIINVKKNKKLRFIYRNGEIKEEEYADL